MGVGDEETDVVGVGVVLVVEVGVGVGVALFVAVGVGDAVGVDDVVGVGDGVGVTAEPVPGHVCDKRIPESKPLINASDPA